MPRVLLFPPTEAVQYGVRDGPIGFVGKGMLMIEVNIHDD